MNFEEKAKELVSKMTLEEKCAQTRYNSPAIKHLGIKEYNYWNEALHGVARAGTATVFPQSIALAATFDEDLVYKVADVISTEGRAKYNMQQVEDDFDIYKGLNFWSPNINIFRDPRWGRGHETYGEDPYLTSQIAVAYIRGIQGDGEYMKAAACAKHFAAHSGPEEGRHSFNSIVSTQDLHETYLPAFKASVLKGNVAAIMGGYNRVNGEPACGSKTLLVDILRGDWQFEGHVPSDCGAIKDFHLHHYVTNTAVESVALAINNGCDLNCGSMYLYLQNAYNEGLVTEETITKSVERNLELRFKLGMFDKTYLDEIPYSDVDKKEHKEINLEAAHKSIVLLKNNGILPLEKNIKSIAVIGPNANNRKALIGNYEGTSSKYTTILEGLQEICQDNIVIRYSEGCHLYKDNVNSFSKIDMNDRLAEAKALAKISDVVVLCMGLDPSMEGEEGDENNQFASGDRLDIELPRKQKELIEEISKINKNIILISTSGSCINLNGLDVDAIIQNFYGGSLSGKAIANVIFGEYNPEGKLPITFYNSINDLPDFSDYSMVDRTYRYMKVEPQYPFGFGLTYSNFKLDCLSIDINKKVNLNFNVENNSKVIGTETLQIYIKANSENTPNPQLKKIKKIKLGKFESQNLNIEIEKDDFKLADENGEFKLLDCSYTIYVSFSSINSKSKEFGVEWLEEKIEF